MSEEDVERMRQAFAAFERGDKDTWRALNHPDIEVVPSSDWPEGHIQGREKGSPWGKSRPRDRQPGCASLVNSHSWPPIVAAS